MEGEPPWISPETMSRGCTERLSRCGNRPEMRENGRRPTQIGLGHTYSESDDEDESGKDAGDWEDGTPLSPRHAHAFGSDMAGPSSAGAGPSSAGRGRPIISRGRAIRGVT
jgi:hypothetical protein